jgi:glycosyltransferase involved in cell wall biosynthesis
MAAGIPAIGTPAGDVRRVIVDDVTGFVVPFEGVAKIAERLVQLADDAALRKRMGAAARQWVEQEYSLASIAPRLLWIYRNALAARRRAKIEPRLSAH